MSDRKLMNRKRQQSKAIFFKLAVNAILRLNKIMFNHLTMVYYSVQPIVLKFSCRNINCARQNGDKQSVSTAEMFMYIPSEAINNDCKFSNILSPSDCSFSFVRIKG